MHTEFMFEALRSRKNSLMLLVKSVKGSSLVYNGCVYRSLFSCLTQLATVEDFYSKGHMVYGEGLCQS